VRVCVCACVLCVLCVCVCAVCVLCVCPVSVSTVDGGVGSALNSALSRVVSVSRVSCRGLREPSTHMMARARLALSQGRVVTARRAARHGDGDGPDACDVRVSDRPQHGRRETVGSRHGTTERRVRVECAVRSVTAPRDAVTVVSSDF
jgi:hypothetical protein